MILAAKYKLVMRPATEEEYSNFSNSPYKNQWHADLGAQNI